MKKFKHGDVVSVRPWQDSKVRTLAVVLFVDLSKHPTFIAGSKNGLYFFRGQWYGNNLLNYHSYGKCEGQQDEWNKDAYKVGSVKSFHNKKFY